MVAAIADGHDAPWRSVLVDDGISSEFKKIISLNWRGHYVAAIEIEGSGFAVRGKAIDFIFCVKNEKDILKYFRETQENQQKIQEIKQILAGHGFFIPAEFDLGELKLVADFLSEEHGQLNFQERQAVYSAIKKIENYPAARASGFRLGKAVCEKLSKDLMTDPPDILVHLAYFRRHSKDTHGALAVTKCLTPSFPGHLVRNDLRSSDRCVLATERAAALMDLFEQGGTTLLEAEKFLRMSQRVNGGRQTEENLNAWRRFNRLSGRS